jgi:hypothetical protein
LGKIGAPLNIVSAQYILFGKKKQLETFSLKNRSFIESITFKVFAPLLKKKKKKVKKDRNQNKH